MGVCSALNCNSSSKDFQLHAYPVEPTRRLLWVQNSGRAEDWLPTTNSRLCEVSIYKN